MTSLNRRTVDLDLLDEPIVLISIFFTLFFLRSKCYNCWKMNVSKKKNDCLFIFLYKMNQKKMKNLDMWKFGLSSRWRSIVWILHLYKMMVCEVKLTDPWWYPDYSLCFCGNSFRKHTMPHVLPSHLFFWKMLQTCSMYNFLYVGPFNSWKDVPKLGLILQTVAYFDIHIHLFIQKTTQTISLFLYFYP